MGHGRLAFAAAAIALAGCAAPPPAPPPANCAEAVKQAGDDPYFRIQGGGEQDIARENAKVRLAAAAYAAASGNEAECRRQLGLAGIRR